MRLLPLDWLSWGVLWHYSWLENRASIMLHIDDPAKASGPSIFCKLLECRQPDSKQYLQGLLSDLQCTECGEVVWYRAALKGKDREVDSQKAAVQQHERHEVEIAHEQELLNKEHLKAEGAAQKQVALITCKHSAVLLKDARIEPRFITAAVPWGAMSSLQHKNQA